MSILTRLSPTLLTKAALLRLGLLGCLTASSVWLGFFAFTPEQGLDFFKRYGYFTTLVTLGIWLFLLIRTTLSDLSRIRAHLPELAGVVLLILSLISIYRWAEPEGFNIFSDEPSLAAGSLHIHQTRQFGLPVMAEYLDGEFAITSSSYSKRPFLYPFLVATLHDLTGYRVANTWLTNQLLAAAILGLLYRVGRHISGKWGGLLALLFFGSLPLFAHASIGAGLDLLNTFFLLMLLWLGIRYLDDPTGTARAGAVAVTGVLLSQSRTEAIIMVLPVALLLFWGWVKARNLILPTSALLCPVLLIPTAWHLRIFQLDSKFFEFLDDRQPFGPQYLFGWKGAESNLLNAFEFYLTPTDYHAMAGPLTIFALVAWGISVWWLLHGRRLSSALHSALLIWGGGILFHWLLIHCYYWGQLTDPLASRFALPSLLLLALGAPVALALAPKPRRRTLTLGMMTAALSIFVLISLPLFYYRNYSTYLPMPQEHEWAMDWAKNQDKATTLILTKRPLPWITEEYAVIDPWLAPQKIGQSLKQSPYQSVYAMQRILREPATGQRYEEDAWELPEGWRRAELISQHTISLNIYARIYRIAPIAQ